MICTGCEGAEDSQTLQRRAVSDDDLIELAVQYQFGDARTDSGRHIASSLGAGDGTAMIEPVVIGSRFLSLVEPSIRSPFGLALADLAKALVCCHAVARTCEADQPTQLLQSSRTRARARLSRSSWVRSGGRSPTGSTMVPPGFTS